MTALVITEYALSVVQWDEEAKSNEEEKGAAHLVNERMVTNLFSRGKQLTIKESSIFS